MLLSTANIFRMQWYYGKFNFQHLLDANLCAGAVVISLGPILGKISMPQYLILILTETVGVTFNYTLLRQVMKVIDIGGTLTVHLYGALFGGIFSFISFLSNSEKERIRYSRHLGTNYNSNVFALFGSLFLISYWPAFNTCLLDDDLTRKVDKVDIRPKYEGMINTYLAIIGSIIGTFISSPLVNNGKLVLEDIINSSFAGGIAIGGCCHLIPHYFVSIIFGVFAGALTCFLCNILSQKFKFNGYHDTANAAYYHFGDIDAGGFYILLHLRRKTGVPFQPYKMDISTLKDNLLYTKKLTDNDRTRLGNLLDSEFKDTISFMLENNCKLEQEALNESNRC